jgi:hypothetical protein
LFCVVFLPAEVETAAFCFGVGAWDAGWRVLRAVALTCPSAPDWTSVRVRAGTCSSCDNSAALIDGTRAALAFTAGLTGRRIWDAGVLGNSPRLPGVVWAGFGAAFRDATTVVGWTALDLRLVFDLADWRAAGGDARIRLARNGLTLGEGCSTCNIEGAVDWLPISPRTSITSRLNITAP